MSILDNVLKRAKAERPVLPQGDPNWHKTAAEVSAKVSGDPARLERIAQVRAVAPAEYEAIRREVRGAGAQVPVQARMPRNRERGTGERKIIQYASIGLAFSIVLLTIASAYSSFGAPSQRETDKDISKYPIPLGISFSTAKTCPIEGSTCTEEDDGKTITMDLGGYSVEVISGENGNAVARILED